MNKISVIIPLYNKEPHIARALNSVLSQTVSPKEIIVVDDGSSDGGGEIVKSYQDPKIKLLSQENQGVSSARNRGIAEAQGELIAFLDADDAWHPNFLKEIDNLYTKFPRAGIFATAYEKVTPKGTITRPEFNFLSQASPHVLIENYFEVAMSIPLSASAVAIPKKILEEINGFQVGCAQGEDIDVWLRISFHYPIAWSRQYLSSYYTNAVNRVDGIKFWQDEPVFSRLAREAISSGLIPSNQVKDLKEYVANFQLEAACHSLILGNKKLARIMLEYARGTRKYAIRWHKYRILAAIPGNPSPFLYKLLAAIFPTRFSRNL